MFLLLRCVGPVREGRVDRGVCGFVQSSSLLGERCIAGWGCMVVRSSCVARAFRVSEPRRN